MQKYNNANFGEFIKAMWVDWGSRASGLFSVPFAILATFTDSNNARPIWIAMATLAFMSSIYQLWANERKRVVTLCNELEDNRPIFHIAHASTITGHPTGTNNSSCIMNVLIINRGFPSTIIKWNVDIKKDNQKLNSYLFAIPKDGIVLDEFFTLMPSDSIYDKAVTPIPQGGYIAGWLPVIVENILPTDLRSATTFITISLEDAWGNKSSVTSDLKNDPPGKYMYVPDGSGGPRK